MKTHQSDVIRGLSAIAAHLGVSHKVIQHRQENGELPTFKPEGTNRVFARKSELDRYLAERVAPRLGRPPSADPAAQAAAREQRAVARKEARSRIADEKAEDLAIEKALGLLYGVEAIARFVGLSVPSTRHQIRSCGWPVFRQGRIICARRTTLIAYFETLEGGR